VYSNFRSFTQKEVRSVPTVPDFALLFYYGKTNQWSNTYSGNLDTDYYIRLTKKTNFFGGSTNVDWPVARCVDDFTIDSSVGMYYPGDVADPASFSNTATLLDFAGGHTPLATNFQSQPTNSFAIVAGDIAANTDRYAVSNADGSTTLYPATFQMLNGPHTGHQHLVEGSLFANAISSFVNLSTTSSGNVETLGIPQVTVSMLLKDPTITNQNKILTFFPKNIIVYGQDLPANNYSRTDPYWSNSSNTVNQNPTRTPDDLSNTYFVSCYKNDPIGAQFKPVKSFSLTSNNCPNHDHISYPPTNLRRSTKLGQTASIFGSGGAHSHSVKYLVNAYLQGKKLKAYFTTQDKTLIANGVIIGYSPSTSFGYSGPPSYSTNLPPHWHVCDGNNGTPDLRGYYVGANFNDDDHDVDISIQNDTMQINSITVAANGVHSHASPGQTNITGQIGSPKDIGSHLTENSTLHTHVPSIVAYFKTSYNLTKQNINGTTFSNFDYNIATLDIAFIMYNENIA